MILHIDMDAFYASIEIRDNPKLAGKPVVVGGRSTTRGVIAAASYEARKFGVRSAMPTIRAFKLCPDLVLLPVNMEKYVLASQKIHEIFNRYTPEIEPLSLDEAFLDVTASINLFGEATTIGRTIQNDIDHELGLVASVGVATNKFIAKIASDLLKPNGFCVVPLGSEQKFLDPLPIQRLWGVGKKTAAHFKLVGLNSIRDVRLIGQDFMAKEFGHSGEQIWCLANGKDRRPVDSSRRSKSVSNETTFASDITDISELRAHLMTLVEQVSYRLRFAGLQGRTINLKLRDPDFKTITRSKTLYEPVNGTDEIWCTALGLMLKEVPESLNSVRLLGVGVTNFKEEKSHQVALFSEDFNKHGQNTEKMPKLDKLSDEIRRKFGQRSIQRGRSTKI